MGTSTRRIKIPESTLVHPNDFKGQWWGEDRYPPVKLSEVRALCIAALRRAGVAQVDATFTVDTLLDKDLQGDHLRGISDVPRWVGLFQGGEANPRPKLRLVRRTKVSALVDDDPAGFYLSISRQATELCLGMARRNGIATVAVRKNLGTLVPIFKMATAADMVIFGTIQGPPVIAPSGGKKPLIGNNPTGVGIPAGKRHPVILDVAFSQTSATPVFNAAATGRPVPHGVLLDSEGQPTTDPLTFAKPSKEARGIKASQFSASQPGSFTSGGSLVPIGGFKGYALALAFGLLTNVLIARHPEEGEGWGNWYHGSPGTLLIAISPALFCDLEPFKKAIDKELSRIIGSPRRKGADRIYYPGERSQELQARGKRLNRVELPAASREALEKMSKDLKISADLRTIKR